MSVSIYFRWRVLLRRLPGICQKRVLILIGLVFVFIVLFQKGHVLYSKRKAATTTPQPTFEFSLQNTPYTSLNNSQCVLQSNGQWNCPDIRRQGNNKLRQSQLVAIRMLRIFDALCKKHGFRYWITRGTLLGAVRHQGYIPWDTDLDVEMPIEDYVEFIKKAFKTLPPGMSLQRGKNERHFDSVFLGLSKVNSPQMLNLTQLIKVPNNPRFRDEKSCYKYCIKFGCASSWPDGMMIDIYPIAVKNNFYLDQFERTSILTKLRRFFFKPFGYDFGYRAFPLKNIRFEGFKVPASNDWEKLLKDSYGKNYMALLPREKRRPPDNLVPDPFHSCSEFDKKGKLKG